MRDWVKAMAVTKTDIVAASEKWSRASLRIAGDTLKPDEVGAILGLDPTRSGLKGERVGARNSAVRRTSFWILQCPLDTSLPLQDHLEWLLNNLDEKRDLIRSISERWKVEFFCGFASENGQGGATFEPALLRRLATFGIPLILDLYPPDVMRTSCEKFST